MASFRKRGELQWQARISRKKFPPQVKTFNTRAEAEATTLRERGDAAHASGGSNLLAATAGGFSAKRASSRGASSAMLGDVGASTVECMA
jgi:hypothetical protein